MSAPLAAPSRPPSRAAMREAMDRIMAGAVPQAELAEFLLALARRGETAEEIAGGVDSLRTHAVRLPVPAGLALCDTCGTGGDQQHTVNVSTLAALVLAAAGVPVAKHGNRAASSQCGSADVLAALGLNLQASPVRVAASIEQLGFGFCFAPAFHPAMKAVAPVRKALGVRTIFNLIGPLANPAPLAFQLVGVNDARLLTPMAEALRELGVRHALVAHGGDGLDEVTTTRETQIVELRDGGLRAFELTPEAVGLPRVTLDVLRGGPPEDNAARARAILGGEASPATEIVALNAGCALYAADRVGAIAGGVARARELLRAGALLALLDRVVAFSAQPEAVA
jgi:anthranilate phosphoribosyltransferase